MGVDVRFVNASEGVRAALAARTGYRHRLGRVTGGLAARTPVAARRGLRAALAARAGCGWGTGMRLGARLLAGVDGYAEHPDFVGMRADDRLIGRVFLGEDVKAAMHFDVICQQDPP